MLIRKTAEQVYKAFIDPSITKNFWFTKGSGSLEVGKIITWKWEMYNVSPKVIVKEKVQNKKIMIAWASQPFIWFRGRTCIVGLRFLKNFWAT